jgi:tRNA(Ile)-lysidine synthetase-like protein
MDLLAHLKTWLAQHYPLNASDTVVIAVSGGPDSLCLLHLFWRLHQHGGPLPHVVHLDHALRGAESTAEARFVADIAAAWKLPATIHTLPIATLANGQNLQATARHTRYALLAEVAIATNARAVATGHHADDQAETVLLHMLRGAGPAGLRGMLPILPWSGWATHHPTPPPSSALPTLIRPLLGVRRSQIDDYCAEQQLTPQFDSSNAKRDYTRNRIRLDLLPLLSNYNPAIVTSLNQTAAINAEIYDFVQHSLDLVWAELATVSAHGVSFARTAWQALHPAVRSEAVRRAYHLLAPGATLSWERVAAVLAPHQSGRQIELPGGVQVRIGAGGVPAFGNEAADLPQLPEPRLHLPAPGRLKLANDWQLEATLTEQRPTASGPFEALLDPAALIWPLELRGRLPGDHMRPAGGRGGRKIQDLLSEAGIPVRMRPRWPLLLSGDTIIWSPNLRVAAGYTPTPTTPMVVHIRLTKADVSKIH